MLALSQLLDAYEEGSHRYHASFGAKWWKWFLDSKRFRMFFSEYMSSNLAWTYRTKWLSWMLCFIGLFGFQLNSSTGVYKYPWIFHLILIVNNDGVKAVDIRSGASGFQLMLASSGVQVTSVDLLINLSEGIDWRFTPDEFARINHAFGGKINFVKDYFEEASRLCAFSSRAYS